MTQASDALRTTSGLYTTAVRTLVYTDLVGSTSLVSRLGDAEAARLFRRHDKMVRSIIARFQGFELERTDGFLAMFRRPIDGVCYALALHPELEQLGRDNGVALSARAGIHMGEVVLVQVKDGSKEVEAEGMTRIVCSRVMGLAQGGQTLMTRGAWELARRAAVNCEDLPEGVRWISHGPYFLKGVETGGEPDPVEICEAGIEGLAPLTAPPASEKARPAGAPAPERRPPREAPRLLRWGIAVVIGIVLGGLGAALLLTVGSPQAETSDSGALGGDAPGDRRGVLASGSLKTAVVEALDRGDVAGAIELLRDNGTPMDSIAAGALRQALSAAEELAPDETRLVATQQALLTLLTEDLASGQASTISPADAWGALLYLYATGDHRAEELLAQLQTRTPVLGTRMHERRALRALQGLRDEPSPNGRSTAPRP